MSLTWIREESPLRNAVQFGSTDLGMVPGQKNSIPQVPGYDNMTEINMVNVLVVEMQQV